MNDYRCDEQRPLPTRRGQSDWRWKDVNLAVLFSQCSNSLPTMLHALGMDQTQLTYRYAGRDFRLTDVHGNVVREVLA